MSIRRTAKAEPGARSTRAGGFASWAAGLGLAVGLVNLVLLLALIAGRGSMTAGEDASLATPAEKPAAHQALAEAEPPARKVESQPAPARVERRDETPAAQEEPAQVVEEERHAEPPKPAPPEARVGLRLQVLNGAGVARLAARTADALLRQRYDIRETGNTREKAERSRILVRRGGLPLGLRLAEDLGLAPERVLIEADPRLVDVDLTLVVGSDWQELRPYR